MSMGFRAIEKGLVGRGGFLKNGMFRHFAGGGLRRKFKDGLTKDRI